MNIVSVSASQKYDVIIGDNLLSDLGKCAVGAFNVQAKNKT